MVYSKLPTLFASVVMTLGVAFSYAATPITGLKSDWNGYFTSEQSNLNLNNVSSRPDTAHNLLAFSVDNGPGSARVWYSTGVNDAVLDANTVSYTGANYTAFIPSVAESTNAGQGASEDGNSSAFVGGIYAPATPGTVPSKSDAIPYLTDGINGLGLSTFANNVGGQFVFDLSNVDSSTMGDGIPDLFYFNMAAPSSNQLVYEFFDANGMSLGSHSAPENLGGNIARVRNDRFNMGTNSNNGGSQTSSNQNVQGFSMEFSDFAGMSQSDFETAKRLVVTLPNEADPPFFAYNADAFSAEAIVPEPSAGLLMVLGVSLFWMRRRC